MDEVIALTELVREHDEELSGKLRDLADDFDFDAIINLISPGSG